MITKTKIKKAAAIAAVAVLSATTFGWAYAAIVGQGTVTGNATLTQDIVWDNTFPGTATGTVSGIIVTASVAPTLNMSISADTIALGLLTPGVESTGSLNLEIGTNAVSGVKITARSWSGGLTNTSDNTIQINNLTTDWIAENYQFSSVHNAIDDSDVSTFAFQADSDLVALEVNDKTIEHTIYHTNKPENTNGADDVVFTVGATANAQTPAGDYQDNITFTVVGNF